MEQIIKMVIKAYVDVMGAEKWESLSAEEQHDVIMIMVKDVLKATEKV